jgi:4'-phosphopantetheinyl transferase
MQARWIEQSQADVPTHDEWLSLAEAERLGRFRVPKRREDWRLGRWTAKHAVAAYLEMSSDPSALAAIEILAAEMGAPEIFIHRKPALVSLSISHREGRSLCAVAPVNTALGCDLEFVEPRVDAFVADYFTAEEQAMVTNCGDTDRFRLLALLWSAKESTLKALRTGLRMDTRSISVELPEGSDSASVVDGEPAWRPLRTRYSGRVFDGWHRCGRHFIRTLIADPASAAPIGLTLACASLPSV